MSQQHGHGSSQNATYADLKRAWPSCPADQLVHLMRALQSASSAVDGTVKQRAPDNHIQASAEILLTATRNKISGGRTLQDAIVIAEGKSSVEATMDLANYSAAAVSALQAPVILLDGAAEKEITSDDPILHLRSSAAKFSEAASDSMRLYLDLRRKCHDELTQLRSLERSLKLQQDKLVGLDQERCNLLATNRIHGTAGNVDATALVVQLEEIKTAAQNCERVMAQLQRQLPSLRRAYESDSREHVKALEQATRDFFKSKFYLQHYRDPVGSSRRPNYMNNRILMNISHRQLGIDRYLGRGIPRAMGRIRAAGATFENRKALLYNRFSHAATINTHLSYPVYCLRFDRTGRYFITGSDDYLVKVFCVGGFVNVKNNGQMDPAAYARGAILVCTLKGHAGVINDINVSSDNSFLATASEDGDCRVWGLKDGCPVAILRGHTGGANMVSYKRLIFKYKIQMSDGTFSHALVSGFMVDANALSIGNDWC